MAKSFEAVVVGGAGHVGAPLAILLANRGVRTLVHDINDASLKVLASGKLPFFEEDGESLLGEAIAADMIGFSSRPSDIEGIPYIIVTIGTPVDEFHNPVLRVITDCIDSLIPYLSDRQTIILRSTVFPGVTEFLQRHLAKRGKRTRLAFCPERVVQGQAIRESVTLPQIVSGTTPEAEKSAVALFSRFAPKIVTLPPKEAEFAKLFCNAYRYIQFAAANQFYMMAESAGLDFGRLLSAIKQDYPRMRDLPGPGFAAGPCLFKDTLQLVAFAENQFPLGSEAIHINEGLPAFIVSQLREHHALAEKTVGLLGMSFKAESDDIRASLSYKLKKLLRFHAKEVLTTDPFVTDDPELSPLATVVERSDVLVLCVPHKVYRTADLGGKPVFDIWKSTKGAS
ncbi:MAG TPA: nucleotide sugar dehydrogenase [Polyangia bacterium]|nr:nucleotide sugar dehydrogenase [Polyangia bacterium]